MKNKAILAIIMVAVMLVGCGGVESNPKTSEKKEEKIEEVVENVTESEGEDESTEDITEDVAKEEVAEPVPDEPVANTETQKTEKKSQKTETKKTTEPVAPIVTTPVVSEPVATPAPEVKECEHWYQPVETDTYNYIYEMRWGCNGCGYALYDILGDGTAVNFNDMYSHPPCETDRYDEPCVGGGFHSEGFYSGRCYRCHSESIMRSCSYFYVMAERCLKNPSNFGEYEKVEDGCAYIKSCDCGENLLVSDGLTGMGLMLKKEICSYCGDVKTYPEK